MLAEVATNLLAGIGASTLFNSIASIILGGVAMIQPTVLVGLFLGFTIIPMMREILRPDPSPFYYSYHWN